jgi:hypothetical protein
MGKSCSRQHARSRCQQVPGVEVLDEEFNATGKWQFTSGLQAVLPQSFLLASRGGNR